MILAAIHAGVKGIYVEKPLARTPVEADEIVRLCREKGVALAIAHRNRYHPALPLASALLSSGELGKPLEIRARGKEDQRGGGLDLWVLGSHVLNLGVFFAGRPTACSASVLQDGRPATKADIKNADEGIGPILGDEIHARFETESGMPLFFDSKKNAGDKAAGFGLQVVCTGGVIDLRMDSEPMVHVLKGSPFNPSGGARTWVPLTSGGLGKPEPLANIRALVAGHHQPALDLIASMETGKQPLCGPEDGLLLIEMTHAIFASQLRSSARVPLPFEQRRGAFSDL
jgi:predicted dehydrogenase